MQAWGVAITAVVLLMSACGGNGVKSVSNEEDHLKSVSDDQWSALASKKIFFGHQSVGYNLMDGVCIVQGDVLGPKMTVLETVSIEDFSGPVFAHAKVGKNLDPYGKCEDFKRVMESGVGDMVDIAFFKFCYVDVDGKTDVDGLFKHYKKTVDYLAARYPMVDILHCTVPLTTAETGVKANIKKMIGRPLWGDEDNMNRAAFNRLLIAEYGPAVFDLAKYETTRSDGTTVSYRRDGEICNYLSTEYARDDGHLNDYGKRVIGGQLLLFLASRAAEKHTPAERI